MSKCCCKNGADRFAPPNIARNLQFVKNAVSMKHNKAKCNKTKYACKKPNSLELTSQAQQSHWLGHVSYSISDSSVISTSSDVNPSNSSNVMCFGKD